MRCTALYAADMEPHSEHPGDRAPSELRLGWMTAGTLLGIFASGFFLPAVTSGPADGIDQVIHAMLFAIIGALIGAAIDCTVNRPAARFRLQFGIKHLLAYVYIAAWLIYIAMGFVQIYRARNGY